MYNSMAGDGCGYTDLSDAANAAQDAVAIDDMVFSFGVRDAADAHNAPLQGLGLSYVMWRQLRTAFGAGEQVFSPASW